MDLLLRPHGESLVLTHIATVGEFSLIRCGEFDVGLSKTLVGLTDGKQCRRLDLPALSRFHSGEMRRNGQDAVHIPLPELDLLPING